MRAIVHVAPGTLTLRDLPLPAPGPGQVRIRTSACCICATDLVMLAGWERTSCPAVPGHEWSGVVDAVGPGVSPELLGRPCVGDNLLSDGGEVGFEHPGAYAEYFLTEARNLYPLPPDVPLPAAALIEPLAVAVRAVRKIERPVPEPVLLFGDGPLGLLILLVLHQYGAHDITMVGGRTGRMRLARELGASRVLDHRTMEDDLGSGIVRLTGGRFATVIDASGSSAAADAAVHAADTHADVVVVGDYARERAGFRWNEVLLKELRVQGSNTGAGAWPEALRLAVEGGLPLHRLVSHVLPAERFQEGIDLLLDSGNEDVVKVVLAWDPALLPREHTAGIGK